MQKILVEGGAAKGVQLSSGEEIHSDFILSNATPKVTFLDLLDENTKSNDLGKEFLASVHAINYASPVTKINTAVNKIPQFTAIPNAPKRDSVMPHHQCTIHLNCESMQKLEEAYRDAAIRGKRRVTRKNTYYPAFTTQFPKSSIHFLKENTLVLL